MIRRAGSGSAEVFEPSPALVAATSTAVSGPDTSCAIAGVTVTVERALTWGDVVIRSAMPPIAATALSVKRMRSRCMGELPPGGLNDCLERLHTAEARYI